MATPRQLLRVFLYERYSTERAFRRFVTDYFKEALPEIPWGESAAEQAEAFIGFAVERGRVDEIWPALLKERAEYADEIQRIREAWVTTAGGNAAPAATEATAAPPLIDHDRIAEIYRATRDAQFDEVRAALFARLPGALLTLPTAPRPDAQVYLDLNRLNCTPGDPPPLVVWLQNAQLLFEREPIAKVFAEILEQITKAPTPAASKADESFVLETIVLANSRPAIAVMGGTFDAPEDGWKDLERLRAIIDPAIPATGRIETPGHRLPWIGTGVVVGDDLVAVARHTIDEILPGPGRLARSTVFFNPSEYSQPSTQFEATECVLRHPVWNIAFLRVPGLKTSGIRPLVSAPHPPAQGEKVFRVTYVERDPRVDGALQTQVFGGRLNGAKWILPGTVTAAPPRRQSELKKDAERGDMLAYDTNTLGGTGGPVVSLDTGYLLGFGVIRLYLVGNWAVPMWEVIRDRRVRELGIAVPPDAPPPDLPKK
jgi:hypothetical protein